MMRNFTCTIQRVKTISPQTFLITLLVEGEPLMFEPGQYIIVFIRQGDKTLRRLYSVASGSQNGHALDLFIKAVPDGVGSTFLTHSPIGTKVECAGPAGMFKLKDTNNPKIFMTTGTGFAPVRSFLLSQQKPLTQPWHLFWGDQTHVEAGFLDEFVQLKNSLKSFDFTYCLSREESLELIPADFRNYSRIGRIDAVFEANRHTLPIESADFYLCGSRVVVESLRLYLEGVGIAKERVIFEKY